MFRSAFRLSALLPLGLTLLLATAACTRTPDTTDVSTDPSPDAVAPAPGEQVEDTESLLALSGEGLQLVGDQTGSTATLEFGSEMDLVEDAVTSILGQPLESAVNDECGSGPQTITQWPRGLALHAANGEFIGWSSNDADETLTTVAGVGVGSTRSELESAYTVEVFESTLGTEFSTGDLFGLLNSTEPDAAIEYLWAGVTCNFR